MLFKALTFAAVLSCTISVAFAQDIEVQRWPYGRQTACTQSDKYQVFDDTEVFNAVYDGGFDKAESRMAGNYPKAFNNREGFKFRFPECQVAKFEWPVFPQDPTWNENPNRAPGPSRVLFNQPLGDGSADSPFRVVYCGTVAHPPNNPSAHTKCSQDGANQDRPFMKRGVLGNATLVSRTDDDGSKLVDIVDKRGHMTIKYPADGESTFDTDDEEIEKRGLGRLARHV